MKIRVNLVDDQTDCHAEISAFLNDSDDIECTDCFARAEDFYEDFKKGNMPQVVLMDFDFKYTQGAMSGVDCIHAIKERYPKSTTKFIMFTAFQTPEVIFGALKAGALGYVMKSDRDKLVQAIKTVAEGGALMSAEISKHVMNYFYNREKEVIHQMTQAGLTEREQEVLKLLAEGMKYRQIADILYVSAETVNTHVKHIYSKLEVNSRHDARKKLGTFEAIP